MATNKMSKRETARRFFVHSPSDLAQSYVQWTERLKEEPGIEYGCVLDNDIMIPLHPGDVMSVVARPGHGKSSWMAYMARKAARDIVERGAEDEVVVYVTWEQTVEEVEAFFESGEEYSSTDMAWGRVPMDTIKKQAVKRPRLPIWLFGESKRHEGIKRPKMTVDYVYESIEAMRDEYGKRCVLMCMDYVQEIPVEHWADKSQRVDQAIHDAKQLAMRQGLPVIIGVQARREVDSYKNPIPTLSDAQWASAIEQVADKQIAIWRPIKTHDPNEEPTIRVGEHSFNNDEDLFVIKILKQRFDVGYGTYAVRFRPQTLELHDYDVNRSAVPGRNGDPDPVPF